MRLSDTGVLRGAMGVKKRTEQALQKAGQRIGSKVRSVVQERQRVQKNFESRPNNKNYYKSRKFFE